MDVMGCIRALMDSASSKWNFFSNSLHTWFDAQGFYCLTTLFEVLGRILVLSSCLMAFHEGLLESCKEKWCGSYEGV